MAATTDAVVGVFAHVDATVRALEELQAKGYHDVEVYSPAPMHEIEDVLERNRPVSGVRLFTLLGGLVSFPGADAFSRFITAYYYYVLALFCACTALMWLIVHSPFGKTLQAIRDNETRAGFVGVPVRRYRWIAFVISGFFTGLAGALWVPLNGLTTPDILYWPFSGEIVFMTVLGGFRTFTGPIIGAIAFNYLKVYAVASSQYWQMVLGVVLVILVMVLPTGIVGTLARFGAKLRRR